jgi:hypothetical protein
MSTPPPGDAGEPPPPDAGAPLLQEVLPADLTKQPGQVAAPLASVDETIGPSTKATFTDWARISLAGALIGILAVVTVGTGWFVAVYPSKEPAIESFLKLVFTPLIGLVGSIVGFYFGSHTAGGSGNGK